MRGIWEDAQNIISEFGFGVDSGLAVAKAMASPTLSNIQAVQTAFVAEGNTPPPELMNVLWQRYYQAIADNPYAAASTGAMSFLSSPLLWLIGGGIIIYALSSKKRG